STTLRKLGPGALILTSPLPAGTTLDVTGTLDLGGNGFTGPVTGPGTLALGGATLTLIQANDATVATVLTGTGASLVKKGTGSVTLTGTSNYSGTTTIEAGTLAVTAALLAGIDGPLGNASSAIRIGNNTTDNAGLSTSSTATPALGRPIAVAAGA